MASLPRTGLATEPATGPAGEREQGGDGGIPMLTDVLHLPRYQPSELPADLLVYATGFQWMATASFNMIVGRDGRTLRLRDHRL